MDPETGRLQSAAIVQIEKRLTSSALMRRIRFEGGKNVTCTRSHPLPVRRHSCGGGGSGCSSGCSSGTGGSSPVAADGLKPGDRVPVCRFCERGVLSVRGMMDEDEQGTSGEAQVLVEVLSLQLNRQGLCIFAADSQGSEAIAVYPSVGDASLPPTQPVGTAGSTSEARDSTASDSAPQAPASWEPDASSSESDGLSVVQVGPGKAGSVLAMSLIRDIPRAADGSFLSHGTRLHPQSCTPCPWQARRKGCLDAALCSGCHDQSHKSLTYTTRKRLQRETMVGPRAPPEPPPAPCSPRSPIRVAASSLSCPELESLPSLDQIWGVRAVAMLSL